MHLRVVTIYLLKGDQLNVLLTHYYVYLIAVSSEVVETKLHSSPRNF